MRRRWVLVEPPGTSPGSFPRSEPRAAGRLTGLHLEILFPGAAGLASTAFPE